MDLSRTRDLFERQGPFATVYLEARNPGENADRETGLRWRGLSKSLSEQGADDKTIAALDDVLGTARGGDVDAYGRVVVASTEGVLFDETVEGVVASGDSATWSPLPELGAYYRSQSGSVRVLLVVADKTGGDVYQVIASNTEGARELSEETISGSAVETVHKPREGGNAHKQRQRRHEQATYQNAADVVAGIRSAASSFRPEVLVLAGEVQGREVVREQLPKELLDITREIDAGSRAAGASEDALEDALLTEAGRAATEQETAIRQQFHEAKAHANAVEGLERVLEAARTGAVATLLLVEGTEVPGELYVGDSPEAISTDPANLRDISDAKPVARPAENVLVRATGALGGDIAVLGAGTELVDNVGALLRFPTGA
jgi:Bacterial archaeo-eukaryotic release factor family 2